MKSRGATYRSAAAMSPSFPSRTPETVSIVNGEPSRAGSVLPTWPAYNEIHHSAPDCTTRTLGASTAIAWNLVKR